MENYKIGIYNPKVETSDNLKECNVVFDNFNSLKEHVRENDEIIYLSEFSFYDYNDDEFISLIKKYNLKVYSIKNPGGSYCNLNNIVLSIQMIMGINNFIKGNIDIIKKL